MYLYFLYILLRKDPNEFNGVDSFIYEKMMIEDITWIPLKDALSLKKLESEKDDLEDKLKLIQQEIEKITTKYARLLANDPL
jgi:hypothetical protein